MQQLLRQMRRHLFALGVLLVSLLASWAAWQMSLHREQEAARAQFAQAGDTYAGRIQEALLDYELLLVRLGGFFAAEGGQDPEQASHFLAEARVLERHAGLQTVAFAPQIPAHQRSAFENARRRQGLTGFRIRATGSETDFLPVTYLYPDDARTRETILGLDIRFDPVRRQALQLAHSRARPTASGTVKSLSNRRINLVLAQWINSGQAGGAGAGGVVLAGLDMETLLRTLYGRERAMLHQVTLSNGGVPAARLNLRGGQDPAGSCLDCLRHTVTFERLGRQWTLSLYGLPALTQPQMSGVPLLVLAGGLVLSCLLAGLTVLLHERRRLRQEQVDRDMRYRSLFLHSPDAVFSMDGTGRFLAANEVTCQLLGLPERELLGKTLWEFVPGEHMAEMSASFELARLGQAAATEIYLLTASGTQKPVHISNMPIIVEGNVTALFGVAKEITRRKQAERQTHRMKQLLDALIEHIPVMVYVQDAEGGCVVWNHACEVATGISRAEVLGHKVLEVLDPEARETLEAVSRQAQATELVQEIPEVLIVTRHRGPRWMHICVVPFGMGEERYLLAVAEDISERLLAQDALLHAHAHMEDRVRERTAELHQLTAALRSLSGHLQTVREEERQRIAREIHDDLGATLTAIKFELSLGGSLAADNQARMLQLVDSSIDSLRRIITDLRPSILDELGLWPALDWMAQEFTARSGIRCSFELEGPEIPLCDDWATALFRIVQEALTNVVRHAGASRVSIHALVHAEEIVLAIHDNGRGLDENACTKSTSYGLLGMRERARLFQGSVSIENGEGGGAHVFVRMPLAALDSLETVVTVASPA